MAMLAANRFAHHRCGLLRHQKWALAFSKTVRNDVFELLLAIEQLPLAAEESHDPKRDMPEEKKRKLIANVRAIAEKWRPWRAYATLHLWLRLAKKDDVPPEPTPRGRSAAGSRVPAVRPRGPA